MIDESYSYYLRPRTLAAPPSLNTMIEEEVFGADLVVKFDDYFLFPTMAEALREIVPLLEHRKQKGRDVVRLFFDEQNRHSADEPLFIIDGVITDNTTYFLSLKPAEVVGVKIIHTRDKLAHFGRIGKNGIVLVETKIPNNAMSVPRSRYMLAARGLASPRPSPRSRGMAVEDPKVPDLRTNLYWNPEVETGPDGTVTIGFKTSDVTGAFRVKVEGLTAEGEPFSVEETFRVFFQRQ